MTNCSVYQSWAYVNVYWTSRNLDYARNELMDLMSAADGEEEVQRVVQWVPQARPELEQENISTGDWVEEELSEYAAGLAQVSTVKPQLVRRSVAMGETHTG